MGEDMSPEPGDGRRTVPFTDVEEAVFNLEETYTPWNVQLELETGSTVDLDRLRDAIAAACDAHPLVRARKRPNDGWESRYRWEIPDRVDEIPLDASVVESASELARTRTAFYGETIDLTSGLPFRVHVLRTGEHAVEDATGVGAGGVGAPSGRTGDVSGGDRLLLNANHVAADGVGALRLLRSICRAYRGEAPVEDPVSLEQSRSVLSELEPSTVDERVERLGSAVGHLVDAATPPTRVAADSDTDAAGWGFVHRRLDGALTKSLVEDRPEGVSVNDVLLAALHLAIEQWNQEHDESSRKISLMMPVNLRPRERFYDGVGMYALFESVTTRPSDRRSPQSTVAAVAERTADLEHRDRAAALNDALDLIPPGTPVGLKRQLPELLRGPGTRLLDTAVLSNLGRVPRPGPTLSDAAGTLWFSPPAWGPTPLGIGVATVEGTVTLVFRHILSHLDRTAGEAFADLYLDRLDRVAT